MDFSRNEILEILSAMGVEMPSETKLSTDTLQSRLYKTIECAQPVLKAKSLPNAIHPSKLKLWSEVSTGPLLMSVVQLALNHQELGKLDRHNRANGISEAPPSFKGFSYDLRGIILGLAKNWDVRSRLAIVNDEAGTFGMTIHVVEVYALTNEIPLFVVLYEYGPAPFPQRPSSILFIAEGCEGMVTGQNATLIKACAESQRLLIKILEENAKRLDPTYSTPPRRTCERNYTLSFLTVISSLTMRDIGSLVHDLGCTLCGSPTKSRCAQCHSVSYCGKECQSKDWKTHKPTCRSLAGGKWITVTFTPREKARGLYGGAFLTNLHAPGTELRKRVEEEDRIIKRVIEKMKTFNPEVDSDKHAFDADDRKALKALRLMNRAKARLEGQNIDLEDTDADSDEGDVMPLPNIHDDNAFVAKIQVPPPEGDAIEMPALIYDRRRSIECFVMRNVDMRGFRALETVARREGYLGQKIYRWCKRVGEKQLAICLDRQPPPEHLKW